jgi:hypothetical protein
VYLIDDDDMQKLVKAVAADPELADNLLWQLRISTARWLDDVERAKALAKATGEDVEVPAQTTTTTRR